MVDTDLTTWILSALALEGPDVNWKRHSAVIATELTPALELQFADMEPERKATHMTFLARDLVREAGGGGARVSAAVQDIALDLRLSVLDRWITSATQRVACGGESRARFESRAVELERELMALDDRVRAARPAAHAAVADQLSEMYLDLEYLQTGIDGSLRLARLLDEQANRQTQDTHP